MLFDKFARITENNLIPGLNEFNYQILEKLKLFKFEGISHEILPKEIDDDYINENFFLPFDIVGIEDNASLVILINSEPNQSDFKKKRYFIEVISSKVSLKNFGVGPDPSKYDIDLSKYSDNYFLRADVDEIICIAHGVINYIVPENKYFGADTNLYHVHYFQGTDTVHPDDSFLREFCFSNTDMRNASAINAMTALQQIAFMNSDNFFILESRLKKQRKNKSKKNTRILRSHERSNYIMLRPKEIRDRLNLPLKQDPNQTRKSPHPHDRRAYRKTIHPNDPEKRRRIKVRATWVGPNIVETNKRIYKVLLDR